MECGSPSCLRSGRPHQTTPYTSCRYRESESGGAGRVPQVPTPADAPARLPRQPSGGPCSPQSEPVAWPTRCRVGRWRVTVHPMDAWHFSTLPPPNRREPFSSSGSPEPVVTFVGKGPAGVNTTSTADIQGPILCSASRIGSAVCIRIPRYSFQPGPCLPSPCG